MRLKTTWDNHGYRSHYNWDNGLALRDWRYVVRIANIDVSDLDATTPVDIVKLMIKALHRMPIRETDALLETEARVV